MGTQNQSSLLCDNCSDFDQKSMYNLSIDSALDRKISEQMELDPDNVNSQVDDLIRAYASDQLTDQIKMQVKQKNGRLLPNQILFKIDNSTMSDGSYLTATPEQELNSIVIGGDQEECIDGEELDSTQVSGVSTSRKMKMINEANIRID